MVPRGRSQYFGRERGCKEPRGSCGVPTICILRRTGLSVFHLIIENDFAIFFVLTSYLQFGHHKTMIFIDDV